MELTKKQICQTQSNKFMKLKNAKAYYIGKENNQDKFSDGYIIFLEKNEKYELIKNFDRFDSLKHSSAPIKMFTEKGLYGNNKLTRRRQNG